MLIYKIQQIQGKMMSIFLTYMLVNYYQLSLRLICFKMTNLSLTWCVLWGETEGVGKQGILSDTTQATTKEGRLPNCK